MKSNHTALVTGATSGLGFEAAVHLADEGYGRIIVTGRNEQRAEAAAAQLAERTGKAVFEPLALDLNNTSSVEAAGRHLAQSDELISGLILNAGMVPGSEQVVTDEGVEITFASSLVGHHRFTMNLLADGLLDPQARIIIAGSEAARGDVPTFNPVELRSYAAKHFQGDREAAAGSLIEGSGPLKYKPGDVYATAKLFVAWWSAELAQRLPAGMTVNTVSPGSAPATDAARNANFFMRNIMMPVLLRAPKRLGLAATVPTAARRYVDALDFGAEVSGEFFASAPKKMTGPLHRVELPNVLDRENQQAAWQALVRISDGVTYPTAVPDEIPS